MNKHFSSNFNSSTKLLLLFSQAIVYTLYQKNIHTVENVIYIQVYAASFAMFFFIIIFFLC